MLAFYLALADKNDKSLIEQIYIRYKNLMFTQAFEILGDAALAEDAVHDAFMRIIQNTDKLESPDSPRTRGYVVIVTVNVAKTMYRKNNRQTVMSLDEEQIDDSDVISDVETKLTAELVAEKIALLPERYREVMLLRFLHNLSDKEIASSLGISRSNVRKRLERARSALKKLLGGEVYG
ncbi:MAG: sigma-70 family RNA polymerase sigma factor [Ruminococcus sp.]|nr:sigma-70 family RNA polymerase sigma factor [Ruminococcus sp.]